MSEQVSQLEVNKTVRVLQLAKPLKFTAQVHLSDGHIELPRTQE
jgi:hypothetical protein